MHDHTHTHTHIVSVWLIECDTVWLLHFAQNAPPPSLSLSFCPVTSSFYPSSSPVPYPLITPSSLYPLLSSHLSLLCHITHPVRRSLPISPSLTPPPIYLASSRLSIPLLPLPSLPPPHPSCHPSDFGVLFLFHPISSPSHHLFTLCLVSRSAKVSVTHSRMHMCTHTHTHTFLWTVSLSVFLNLYFSCSPSSVILWRKGDIIKVDAV